MDVFVVLLLSGLCIPTASFQNIYYFINDKKTWEDALDYCLEEHTEFAQITDLNINTAIQNFPTTYTGKAWIGLSKDKWLWVNGQPATYFEWNVDQPGQDTCVYMSRDGYWNTFMCTELKGSVCFNGSHYLLNQTTVNWKDAKTDCERKNTTLAQIHDSKTNNLISRLLSSDQSVWIGLKFSPLQSETEQTITKTNWLYLQPDNENSESCAAIAMKQRTWTSEPCDVLYPFLCYEIYEPEESKKTVVSMNFQTTENLENPVNSDTLMKQLEEALTKQSVTDVKLNLTKQPVKVKRSKKTEDPR